MALPWTVVHKPKKISEVVGNSESIEQFIQWMRSWEKKKPLKRAAFLHGPPGVGKTVVAEAYATEHNYDLVEMNASDWRTAEAIQRVAGVASMQTTLYGVKKRMIILDELDGISGREDRGGVGAIVDVVKNTQCPIILIANNAWDPRFTYLRQYCLPIEFKRIPYRSIVPYLRKICEKENIRADEEALKLIAERSRGDVRSAINDLQALAQGCRSLTYEDVDWLAYRDRQESIFEVLRTIFTADNYWKARKTVDLADVDYEMLFEWIYENAPYQLTHPNDLCKAMENLAKVDIYLRRVKATQDWGLLGYALDLMTSGVAMSREKTYPRWVPFKFPQRIKLLSKMKGEKAIKLKIGAKIRAKCHISATAAAKEYLPYLKVIFESDPEMGAGLARWFGLDDEMVEYLAGSEKRAKIILKSLEKAD